MLTNNYSIQQEFANRGPPTCFVSPVNKFYNTVSTYTILKTLEIRKHISSVLDNSYRWEQLSVSTLIKNGKSRTMTRHTDEQLERCMYRNKIN